MHAARQDAHTWTVRDYVTDAVFTLPALEIELSLTERYEGLEALREELGWNAAPDEGGR